MNKEGDLSGEEILHHYKVTLFIAGREFYLFERMANLDEKTSDSLTEEDLEFMKSFSHIAMDIKSANGDLFRRKEMVLREHGEGIERFCNLKSREVDSAPEELSVLMNTIYDHLEYMKEICLSLEAIDSQIIEKIRIRFLMEGFLLGESEKIFY